MKEVVEKATPLTQKAEQLEQRGKSVHGAACRLRLASAYFVAYELQKEVLPARQWAKKQPKLWKTFVELGKNCCCEAADKAFKRREYALALRAWRFALTYDGCGNVMLERTLLARPLRHASCRGLMVWTGGHVRALASATHTCSQPASRTRVTATAPPLTTKAAHTTIPTCV
jgi:hypothetical protein